MNNHEALFKELAQRYVEEDGRLLNEERAAQKDIVTLTLALDKRVQKGTSAKKQTRNRWIVSLVAAAAVMVLLMPGLLRNFRTKDNHSGVQNETMETQQLIPISFTLPQNLSVADSNLDRGQSVYALDNTDGDHVVMALEKNAGLPDITELRSVTINGQEAYALQRADYQFLVFEKDNVTYTLTCRYQIDTLVSLGKNIL